MWTWAPLDDHMGNQKVWMKTQKIFSTYGRRFIQKKKPDPTFWTAEMKSN